MGGLGGLGIGGGSCNPLGLGGGVVSAPGAETPPLGGADVMFAGTATLTYHLDLPPCQRHTTYDPRPTTHDLYLLPYLRPTTYDLRPTTYDLYLPPCLLPTPYDLRPTTYYLAYYTRGRHVFAGGPSAETMEDDDELHRLLVELKAVTA